MIACTVSYECERKTVGKLYAAESVKWGKGYFNETDKKRRRFPTPRLTEGRDRTLTGANEFLAAIYTPINFMGQTVKQIKRQLLPEIASHLDELQAQYNLPTRGGRKSLLDIYADMAIGSPAICALRVFDGNKVLAEKFAGEVANMFDKPEAIAAVELSCGKSDDAHYRNVLKYCVDGNFAAMLDEYAHVLNDNNEESLCSQMCEAMGAVTASYSIDTYASFTGSKKEQIHMRSHFAAGFYQTQSDEKTSQRKENLRTAFNAPFRPFVLATTSIGQEGLDFHNYARKVMHWNLPHNPIDLEQREGRINRYKCLAIRQSLAQKYKGMKFSEDVWNEVFERALKDKDKDAPELVPYWCLPDGAVKIERIVPMYPYSKDKAIYERLLKILSLYRVTMGQARQEELLEYLWSNRDADELMELFINLSPITKEEQHG